MENLFDKLKSDMPAAVDTASQEEKTSSLAALSTDALVDKWQKNTNDKALTSEVLRRMRPTMSAAINSYAAGMDSQMSVKAARLTLNALRTYDKKRGVAASTYVFHNLKRLNRLGAKAQNIIPQSEYASLGRKAVKAAMDEFIDRKGREPSMAELADATGLSVKKLEQYMDQGAVVSESSTLYANNQKDKYGKTDLTDDDYFEYVYASVDPISQKIMEWSSGLHGARTLNNNQIADRLHITPAAVSQRKNRIQRLLSDARSLV